MASQFNHSIKVPRLYKEATKVIKQLDKGGSLKSLVASANHTNKKGLAALVIKTLQHKQIIRELFNSCDILKKEPRLDETLASVLTTELLWGKKSIKGEAKPIQTILKYEDIFNAKMSSKEFQGFHFENLDTIWRPRYVRVNTLVSSLEEVIESLKKTWTLLPTPTEYSLYIECIKNKLNGTNFIQDIHLKEILAFPFGTVFANNQLYHDGILLLQDKASCMVSRILDPEPGSTVLDMCAAPGMKTTHLAAYMNNDGYIYAVEKDEERYENLKKTVTFCKATCVLPVHRDAFKITNDMFPDVEYILLDPSCSGSGMLTLLDRNVETDCSKTKLREFSNLQIKLLKHALTHFPKVKRVVYSTCSTSAEENEKVVDYVMRGIKEFKQLDCSKFYNSWNSIGLVDYSCGSKCIRTNPSEDCMNGFFVAAFERIV